MGPNQTYSFCTAKETINKTKRQATDWEKIFANDVTERDQFPKYTNSLYNLILKKQTTQSKNQLKT